MHLKHVVAAVFSSVLLVGLAYAGTVEYQVLGPCDELVAQGEVELELWYGDRVRVKHEYDGYSKPLKLWFYSDGWANCKPCFRKYDRAWDVHLRCESIAWFCQRCDDVYCRNQVMLRPGFETFHPPKANSHGCCVGVDMEDWQDCAWDYAPMAADIYLHGWNLWCFSYDMYELDEETVVAVKGWIPATMKVVITEVYY